MKSRKTSIIPTVILLLVLLAGVSVRIYQSQRHKEETYEKIFTEYFNTVISFSFTTDQDGNALIDHCEEMLQDMEHTFSRTLEGSVVYDINHRTSNTAEVPDDVAELINLGLHYYKVSGGKFDITIAPLSDQWDFISGSAIIPDEKKIQEVLPYVDASSIHLDGNTLTFDNDKTMLDLGAIAKGYAADRIKAYLVENKVTSGILDFGGNVITIGKRTNGNNWRIGVVKPFTTRSDYAAVVEVNDMTVVTSGIYERYFEKDGVIYHHILDPDTGYPIQGDIYSVTIITGSSTLADALSTTCLVLSYEKARELIDSLEGVEAIFILDTGELIQTF